MRKDRQTPWTQLYTVASVGVDGDDPSCNDGDSLDEEDVDPLPLLAHDYNQQPAPSRRKKRTVEGLCRQRKIWYRYCRRIERDPKEALLSLDMNCYKAYFEWLIQRGRIKAISTLQTYWKQISSLYAETSLGWMEMGVLNEMSNHLRFLQQKYSLREAQDDKSPLYVDDLDNLLFYHWVHDTRAFVHERQRVTVAMAFIIIGVMASRPSAVLALRYEDLQIQLFPADDPQCRPDIVMKLKLTDTKSGKPIHAGFREEFNLIHCVQTGLLALAIADKAFLDDITCLEDIYKLRVPPTMDRLKLQWKAEWSDKFIFRQGSSHSDHVTYQQCLQAIQVLGRACGYEEKLRFYQIRRGSGKKLTEELTMEERNQIMDHIGGTSAVYRRFYMTGFIDKDIQAITFGSPPRARLLHKTGRIARDTEAPTTLTTEQSSTVNVHPDIVQYKKARSEVRDQIRKLFGTVVEARGSDIPELVALVKSYDKLNNQITSRKQGLRRELLNTTITTHHETASSRAITDQMNGKPSMDQLVKSRAAFEYAARSQIASLFSHEDGRIKSQGLDEKRAQLVNAMAELCMVAESPPKYRTRLSRTSPQGDHGLRVVQDFSHCGRMVLRPQPKKLICPFCQGDSRCAPLKKSKAYTRIDTFGKHIFCQHFEADGHLRGTREGSSFRCPFTPCTTPLFHARHFAHHAEAVHEMPPFQVSTLPGQANNWHGVVSHTM
ncbi:uncharacterized protein B0I36DRAFT_104296 [Microdochium trichocladiopsis]|uniref:C2H2-type domain-containing protein n=1 Tax=Microdochium trichocladiopsis TaxID=1682393 RepID=A0A9P9BRP7_9PEZI|nr:uncharacterized protein B0I36DRAFT_104296 [Microdochium trichocladiopsis]KAH7033040.1 hypothetical protein B0I36DRAFT_104296 [Microdochium trichocladiopsis]